MKPIRRLTVRAVIPTALKPLAELAGNLRWAWHRPTLELFRHIDPGAWDAHGGDPIAVVNGVGAARFAECAADAQFVQRVSAARDELHAYLENPRWYQSLDDAPASIAYFSPEFGIAEALPQYAGGLGILAGDHLKSASDLGVPLTGVGLLYRSGYFSQSLSADGWQQESYPPVKPDGLPLSPLRDSHGALAYVELALPDDRTLHARIWIAQVGRVPLLLLDTFVPENPPELRTVTDRLYGGGGETRLLQELLLGVGGVRALRVYSSITGAPAPQVFHTNEGHAGFLGLERIAEFIEQSLSFETALQLVRAGTVFTTHTPVAAGIDRFDRAVVERFFSVEALLPGVDSADVLALGSEGDQAPDVFNMAVMGLRLAQRANGVSRLHGGVSRQMFAWMWPGFETAEVPIASVTNGVHAPTWTDPAVVALAEDRLGDHDTTRVDWNSAVVSDEELWMLRGRLRSQLVTDARRRLRAAWRRAHSGASEPSWLAEALDENVLTIGFARRVPSYKRLTLMLRDPDRLRRILTNSLRPVQLVVAGKSHPADDEGKRLIQDLVRFADDRELRNRLVFLPDYDMSMAQVLYPGTDVWLNNPRRPLEACGTSGMKAALNGSLNLSILDGWWDEYYDGSNGWAIGSAAMEADPDERDEFEAKSLYELIEDEIVPRFYDRNDDGVPERWIASIRRSMTSLSGAISAERMVRQYATQFYIPASRSARTLGQDNGRGASELAVWKQRVISAWPAVRAVDVVSSSSTEQLTVGDPLNVRATVALGGLLPSDVAVDVVYGRIDADGELIDTRLQRLRADSTAGTTVFDGTIEVDRAGEFGFSVRVVPQHSLLASSAELGLIARPESPQAP